MGGAETGCFGIQLLRMTSMLLKRLGLVVALLSLCIVTSNCTSNESKDENAAVSEETSEEVIETDFAEGGELEPVDETAASTETAATEAPTEDALPDSSLDETAATSDSGELGFEETPATDTAATPSTEPPVTETAETAPATTETVSEPPKDNFFMSDAVTGADEAKSAATTETATTEAPAASTETTVAEPTPVKANVPLQKIDAAPVEKNGTILNAVYLARPGDTVSGISQKIYGSDRSKDLKRWNASLNNGVSNGEKVYYNSPQRPTDSQNMRTYYEDMGIAPEIYISKSGDNIRTVAKKLLGESDSWKEIWSTNLSVESKGELPEGTQLQYWPSSAAMTTLAKTEDPPMEVAKNEPAMDLPPQEELPPPPPAMDAPPMEDLNPPTEMAQAELPPPPPEPQQVEPPPPPPPPARAQAPPAAELDPLAGMNDDMVMLGGIAVVVISLASIIIIRKRRQKKAEDSAFADTTQVG